MVKRKVARWHDPKKPEQKLTTLDHISIRSRVVTRWIISASGCELVAVWSSAEEYQRRPGYHKSR